MIVTPLISHLGGGGFSRFTARAAGFRPSETEEATTLLL